MFAAQTELHFSTNCQRHCERYVECLYTCIGSYKHLATAKSSFIVTNWWALCGYGKIMQLIYWHIIGWLEYGNFSFILLTPFVCYSRFRDDFAANLVFRVATEWSVLHSAWTRVLFVSANRLRYSLYGHKITRRMWEVDFHSCSKRVTLCVSVFFSLSTRTRFLARPDSQQLKWVWIETKRRVRCDCGTDWTAQIEIWKSKWSSIQMEFKRFVSRLIWINLSGLHVVSLNLFHCITGQTRRSYVILIQLLNISTTESTVSSSKIVAKWIFVSQFFFRPPSLRNFC